MEDFGISVAILCGWVQILVKPLENDLKLAYDFGTTTVRKL